MRRGVRKLRTWLGRVLRDVQRKGGEITGVLKARIETVQRLHAQRRDFKCQWRRTFPNFGRTNSSQPESRVGSSAWDGGDRLLARPTS